jgi:site-specific recombinase XerD
LAFGSFVRVTRHTWATFALQAGKSIRWVAHVLGHADPALTLRVYAHAMREEETDLRFAEFPGGTARHRPSPSAQAS